MLLAIDTAGPNCAAALSTFNNGKVHILARNESEIGRGHAEQLMPMVEDCLSSLSADFSDIERIAATIGPGSFTGVRIGLAAARGLALVLRCSTIGIGVLDALAWPYRNDAGVLVVALDARRGEIFASMAVQNSAPQSAPELTTVEDLAGEIASQGSDRDDPVLIVGSAAPALQNRLASWNRRSTILSEAAFADVASLCEMGWTEEAVRRLEPVYVRRPDAKPQASDIPLSKRAV